MWALFIWGLQQGSRVDKRRVVFVDFLYDYYISSLAVYGRVLA